MAGIEEMCREVFYIKKIKKRVVKNLTILVRVFSKRKEGRKGSPHDDGWADNECRLAQV